MGDFGKDTWVNGAPQMGSVPTPAMRQGIFAKVTDPTTHAPFANNTIPENRWDSAAKKLLPLFPSPNLRGSVRNFFYNPKERLSSDGYSVRVDHRLSSKDFMFARISQSWGENHLPTTLPAPANQQGFVDLTARQIMFSETHTLTPNRVNEFRLGFVYSLNNQDVLGPRLNDQYGIKRTLHPPNFNALP